MQWVLCNEATKPLGSKKNLDLQAISITGIANLFCAIYCNNRYFNATCTEIRVWVGDCYCTRFKTIDLIKFIAFGRDLIDFDKSNFLP